MMVKVKMMLESSDSIQIARSSKKPKEVRKDMGTVFRNRFQVLEDEINEEPSLTLVGNFLVMHLDKGFCNRNAN